MPNQSPEPTAVAAAVAIHAASRRWLFSLGAMTRITLISFRVIVFLLLYNSAFAASFTAADLGGTYSVDSAIIRNHAIPTNFLSFAITLNVDGSFVATNLPAGLFETAAPEARGTWKLRHTSEKGSLFYTGENDWLNLDFTQPFTGPFSTLIEPSWSSLRIYMCYHSGKKDATVFYLYKQK